MSKSDDDFADIPVAAETETGANELIVFFINSAVVSAVPIYLFTSIFKFSLSENFLYYAVVTLVSAVFLTMAYKNVATTKRSKLFTARSGLVNRTSLGISKSASVQEKKKALNEAREKQAAVTSTEAMTYSILYNSLFFFIFVAFLSAYIFHSIPTNFNYVLSYGIAAGLVYYSSNKY
jgi:hypothetical protein